MTAKFWVGGTGTWDASTTTHWSLSSGGAGGAAVPGSGDDITFDASSGGGTVTADTTLNGLTFRSITMGAFTGTLDFSINNPSITLGVNGVQGLNCSGTGTRTLKLGSGTFTFQTSGTNCFTASTSTGLTFVGGSATIVITGNGGTNTQDFLFSGLNWSGNTLTITPRTNGQAANLVGSATLLNMNITNGSPVRVNGGVTYTITNAVNWSGSSSQPIYFVTDTGQPGGTRTTFALAAGSTITWAAFNSIAISGATVTATNSLDLQNNTGFTISAPTGGAGGGSGIIGS